MVADAMLEADQYLGISSMIYDPKKYVHLTDAVVTHAIPSSTCPELESARAILRRLRCRDLYRLVDEVVVPPALFSQFTPPSEASIVDCQRSSSHLGIPALQPRDVIVQSLTIDYCHGDRNPLRRVDFFRKGEESKRFKIRPEQVAGMMPRAFQEKRIRL